MSRPPERYRRASDRITRTLTALVRLGQLGLSVSVLVFVIYLGYAFVVGDLSVREPLFSLSQSVSANIILGVSGVSVCVLNGALILHTLFTGIEDIRDGIVVIFGFAGCGFGAGLLNLTWPVITTAFFG